MSEEEGREKALESDAGAGEREETRDSGGKEEALEKRLADTQRAYHEGQETLKQYQERLAKMEGMMEVMKAGREAIPENQADPFAEIDDDEYWSDYFDSPEKARRLAKKQIDVVGSTILAERRAREAAEKRLEKAEGDLKKMWALLNKPDPAVVEKVERLKKNPKLVGLDDSVLARLVDVIPDGEVELPGVPGGGRRVSVGGDGMDPALARELKRLQLKHGYEE